MIICHKHSDLDLTSISIENILDEDARKVIAVIKLYEKHKVQEELKQSLSENNNKSLSKLNATIYGEGDDDEEYKTVKTEILLLREPNLQLTDKNKLLKELLDRYKYDKNENKISYATITDMPKIATNNHVPNLYIQATSENLETKTFDQVIDKLKNKILIPVEKVSKKTDGTVVLRCTKKSARIGHSGKKCKNNQVCSRCAGDHLTSQCTNTKIAKCANCIFSNTKRNRNYDINHTAIDCEKCEYLKYHIKRKISSTEYPLQPSYPN